MKKHFISFTFIVVAFACSSHVFANDDKKNKPTTSLIFAGEINNKSVFELQVENTSKTNLMLLTIYDECGNTLYKEEIRNSSFKKQFLLDNEEVEPLTTFYFRITDKHTKEATEYRVIQSEPISGVDECSSFLIDIRR